jgi:hypothetical protein
MNPLRKNDVLAANLLFATLAISLGEQVFWWVLREGYYDRDYLPSSWPWYQWYLGPLLLGLLQASFYWAIRRGMFRAKVVVALACAYLAYAGTHWPRRYVAGVDFQHLWGYALLVLLQDLLTLAALVLMFRKTRHVSLPPKPKNC